MAVLVGILCVAYVGVFLFNAPGEFNAVDRAARRVVKKAKEG